MLSYNMQCRNSAQLFLVNKKSWVRNSLLMMLGNLIHSIRLMLLVFTLPAPPIVVAGTVLNFDFFLKLIFF